MFVKNAWYCAGWDKDLSLGRDGLLARRIAGESLVLYRRPDAAVVAMEDRCCHRHAPLSLGRKEGDSIRCMYHGMKFGPDGRCTEIPGMSRIPEKACVRTYPVVERDNWIWVWMGEPAKADPALICEAIGPGDPAWNLRLGYVRVDTNYRQEIANLADLSHVAWVHSQTLGGSEAWSNIKPRHELTERGIDTRYCVRRTAPPSFARHLFPDGALFDIQVHVRMSVPCNFILHFSVHEVGSATEGPTNGRLVLDTFSSQAVTPRDAHSCDYYYSWGCSRATDMPGLTDLMHEANNDAFLEDKAMLEGQYQRMRERPDAPSVDIVHDAGPGKLLWVLDRLLKAEAQAIEIVPA
ncbi:vanillate O-demethylase oxygenase [Methylibium sp. Pch-M]|uniref:aromatic ring-hydroxylating dioxygenase subunit alpha n=1 Tax=Methylibium sp. Pch-M TaxID=2082386 RepID=UPI001012EC62|nr:aromatic ring-hydroxylating dioxygenase subunit alpha [Methylibium sp. Pch-M]QAZ38734.1 vanillate O-demethylase oxygenase [Methylibium sp. Pch-M]